MYNPWTNINDFVESIKGLLKSPPTAEIQADSIRYIDTESSIRDLLEIVQTQNYEIIGMLNEIIATSTKKKSKKKGKGKRK